MKKCRVNFVMDSGWELLEFTKVQMKQRHFTIKHTIEKSDLNDDCVYGDGSHKKLYPLVYIEPDDVTIEFLNRTTVVGILVMKNIDTAKAVDTAIRNHALNGDTYELKLTDYNAIIFASHNNNWHIFSRYGDAFAYYPEDSKISRMLEKGDFKRLFPEQYKQHIIEIEEAYQKAVAEANIYNAEVEAENNRIKLERERLNEANAKIEQTTKKVIREILEESRDFQKEKGGTICSEEEMEKKLFDFLGDEIDNSNYTTPHIKPKEKKSEKVDVKVKEEEKKESKEIKSDNKNNSDLLSKSEVIALLILFNIATVLINIFGFSLPIAYVIGFVITAMVAVIRICIRL